MATALKAVITVTAGIIPNQPLPELTRRWEWTSEDQALMEHPDQHTRGKAIDRWLGMMGQSREYQAYLENPGVFNWTKREWVWL